MCFMFPDFIPMLAWNYSALIRVYFMVKILCPTQCLAGVEEEFHFSLRFGKFHLNPLNFMQWNIQWCSNLTHWGRVTHICVGKLNIIGSDNGLSPERRQAIIWTNTGILLIGPLGTNFSEIFIEIHTFSLKKIRLKMSSSKWRPFCLGLNVLTKKIRLATFKPPVHNQ